MLMLIAAGARQCNWKAIDEAVESGNPDTVKAILDLGWGPGRGINLRTAIRKGNAPIVKFLLDAILRKHSCNCHDPFTGFLDSSTPYVDLIVDSIEVEKAEITHLLVRHTPVLI